MQVRLVGFILVGCGAILLVAVFLLAYTYLVSTPYVEVKGGTLIDAITSLVSTLAAILPKLMYLIIMVVVGFILISKGIEFLTRVR